MSGIRCIAGDETGLLKMVNMEKKSYDKYGSQSRALGVSSMHWVVYGVSLCVCRVNGDVEMWDVVEDGTVLRKSHDVMSGLPEGTAIRSVGCCGRSQTCSSSVLYTEDGQICVKVMDEASSSRAGGSFATSGPVETAASSTSHTLFGGRENDVKLWDLSTGECTWQAKNVPHDEVRLRVPVWIAGVAFFDADESTGHSDIIVTGTGYRQIRMYDVRVQRQPVLSIDTGNEFKFTRVSPAHDGMCAC